jgi:glycosyltransferase involved in cell wall biosynthesis
MNKPFDIFHLDSERGFRGGQRQLLYLACALKARGHRNVIVCRKDSALAAEASRLGLETAYLPFFCELDLVSAVLLRRMAAKADSPVIHAHSAHAAGVAEIARRLGAPAAVVHRRVDFPLSGGFSRKFKYEKAARVIAVSEAIAGVLADSGLDRALVSVVCDGIPANAEECGWAGVNPDDLAPPSLKDRLALRAHFSAEFGINGHAPWIANAAALVPHKDHDNLLAAAVIVLMKRPKAVFLVAGDGPEKERLLGRIKSAGLGGRFILMGQRSDVSSLLKAVDIFALSSWGEGMGSVLLEASSCGAAIAATTAGGIPEIVLDDKSGLLCPPRNAEALAANILRLIEDKPLAERLSESARARLPLFGLARMAEQVENIYENMRNLKS